jgi:predicted oxidoreductase (fatty acid repression mutant protein)
MVLLSQVTMVEIVTTVNIVTIVRLVIKVTLVSTFASKKCRAYILSNENEHKLHSNISFY